MDIGVPKEIKNHEYRVGLTPESVAVLVGDGHRVFVERGAGLGIGADDGVYAAAGAQIVATAEAVFAGSQMIVKVKEPQAAERKMLRAGQILYTYLHLAPDPEQTADLLDSGAVCIAYETITNACGELPLLKPMSQVAGRLSVQVGARALQKDVGGRGVLLGGLPHPDKAMAVAPGRVVIIGGGDVGFNAAQMAVGMQADVTVLERSEAVRARLSGYFGARAAIVSSSPERLAELVCTADLVIGAVLVAGAQAPKLIRREMLSTMQAGSVLVDVAIDQGGCFETSRPTTHEAPTYVIDGVVHYCVANMPGAVARTSTYGLNAATLPYARLIAQQGWRAAMAADRHLLNGLNVCEGRLTYPAVGEALGLAVVAADSCL